MGRAPCCDKNKVKRGPWSPEEDTTLKNYVLHHGTGSNWIALPHKAGLRRCGKSCRLRWLNYLRPDIKHGGFTEEEDNIIIAIYRNIGSRWSVIASQLQGRTDNDIKNYWNTKLKKRVLASAGATALSDLTIINSIPNVMMNCLSTSSPPPPPLQPPALGIDVKASYYGTSDYTTTLSYSDIIHGSIQESVAEIPFNELSNFQDFPLSRVMETKEDSPSNYYRVSTTASLGSPEISCFPQNDSYSLYNDPIISYEANYLSWSNNNYGVAEEFLTELEASKSSSNLLNGFDYVFSGETEI